MAEIHILHSGGQTQFGLFEPKPKAVSVAFGRFAIYKQSQPVQEIQAFVFGGRILLFEGFGHPEETQLVKLVDGWLLQHDSSPCAVWR